MKRKPVLKKFLLFFVVFLAVIFLAKNFILRFAISAVISNVLGTKVEIGHFNWKILNQTVQIKGVQIQNPSDFPKDTPLLDMPELTVKYDLSKILFQKQLHIPLMKLNVLQMTVVKNKDGKINTDALKLTKEIVQKPEDKPAKAEPDSKQDNIEMQIDEFNLNLRKVIYLDYSKAQNGKPNFTFHDLNIKDQKYNNINSAEQLAAIILVSGLKGAAVQGAALYGAQALLGIGFPPLAAATFFSSKDHIVENFEISVSKLFDKTLAFLKQEGEVTAGNKTTGEIKGKFDGSDVKITISSRGSKKAEIIISARKFMIPQINTAQKFIFYLKNFNNKKQ